MNPIDDTSLATPPRETTNRIDPALVTAAEVARLLQISVRTLWRLLSAGQIVPPVRIGGSTRWRLDEVRQWIADGCPIPIPTDNEGRR